MVSMYIESFITYLTHVKKYSQHTISGYAKDVEQFFQYAGEVGVSDIKQVSHLTVRSWMVALMEDGLTAKSINRKLSSLSTFFKYLRRKEIIDRNPMAKVQAPKSSKRLPSYVDNTKMDGLLSDISRPEGFAQWRDYIVVSLLYHTGIRRAELLGIKVGDIDFGQRQIKVLGKGNKERLIPLNDQILEDLSKYMDRATEEFGSVEYLILTNTGSKAYPKLVYNTVNKILRKYNASEKASPHVLRHTFATHLTTNGADINAIKELLGHANLSATQIYTHNNIERLKDVYKKAHPKSEE